MVLYVLLCWVLAVGVHGFVFSGIGVFPLCGVALWWYYGSVLEIGDTAPLCCGTLLWKNFM